MGAYFPAKRILLFLSVFLLVLLGGCTGQETAGDASLASEAAGAPPAEPAGDANLTAEVVVATTPAEALDADASCGKGGQPCCGGNKCGSGFVCLSSRDDPPMQCFPAEVMECGSLMLAKCGGQCTNITIDPKNCGYCGNVCDSGYCKDRVCIYNNSYPDFKVENPSCRASSSPDRIGFAVRNLGPVPIEMDASRWQISVFREAANITGVPAARLLFDQSAIVEAMLPDGTLEKMREPHIEINYLGGGGGKNVWCSSPDT